MQDKIAFSSITSQGLPFYGGNITYHLEVETPEDELFVKASHFRGSLVRATLNDKNTGIIAYVPYKTSLGHVPAGRHKITLTLYGNRINTFGALHNADSSLTWFGPDMRRTTGDAWCYEYRFKDAGILSSSIIEICK